MKQSTHSKTNRARTATLGSLKEHVLPAFIDPIPSDETLRALFDRHSVPRFKANPHAKQGGGACYYSVGHVEKLFGQLLPGRLASANEEEK